MLPLKFSSRDGRLNVLLLGAHCDDIEIGCGGTVMRLKKEYPLMNVKWVIFTSNPARAEEAKNCANAFLEGVATSEVVIYSLRDGHLPFAAAEVKGKFEELKSFQPDVVFTHARHDRHQDHKVLAEMTWNTFRDHLIMEYEIPKYEGDLGHPNFYVALDVDTARAKADAVVNGFPSQRDKQWFDQETFLSLMRIRGIECASATRYAEGFYASKIVI